MTTKYDVLMPPTKLDQAVDAAIAEHNAAFLLTVCAKCAGTGLRYHKVSETSWNPHPCMTCGGTGDPQ